jgi:hypothetical protein
MTARLSKQAPDRRQSMKIEQFGKLRRKAFPTTVRF